MHTMLLNRHFRARLRVRTASEGGRKIGIVLEGYYPDLVFDVDPKRWHGAYLVAETDSCGFGNSKVDLGETKEVDFGLRFPNEVLPQIKLGTTFQMMEGAIPVADCVVTHLYP